MLRGTGATASVIQAAGAPGGGVSAEPKALVVEVKTKPSTPAAGAASSSASVPETLVSTKACAAWVPTCGLCSVAACSTAPHARHRRGDEVAVDDRADRVGERRRLQVDAARRQPACPRAAASAPRRDARRCR